MVLRGILQIIIVIRMSGIASYNKQMAWCDDYSPNGEPSTNEFLTTLRVLHHIRRDMQKKCAAIFLRNSVTDVITYLETHSPKEISNIINLMYNS